MNKVINNVNPLDTNNLTTASMEVKMLNHTIVLSVTEVLSAPTSNMSCDHYDLVEEIRLKFKRQGS